MADPVETDIVFVNWTGYSHNTDYAGYLGVTRTQLRTEVSTYFGFVETYDRLNTSQRRQVDSSLSRGLRQFYYPEPVGNDRTAHQWSFLKPSVAFVTVADENRYTLPLDFGGILGDLQYETTTSTNLRSTPIRVTSMHEINEAERRLDWQGTGIPHLVAIEPRELIGLTTASTRYNLRLYPTPTSVYSIRMQYNALGPHDSDDGDTLDSTNRYMVGSAQHAETIICSCLAIAEQMADSRNRNTRQQEQYLRRLKASVALDRIATTPETVGVMTDPSNYIDDRRRTRDISSITYTG